MLDSSFDRRFISTVIELSVTPYLLGAVSVELDDVAERILVICEFIRLVGEQSPYRASGLAPRLGNPLGDNLDLGLDDRQVEDARLPIIKIALADLGLRIVKLE